jgi:hypothetical protein
MPSSDPSGQSPTPNPQPPTPSSPSGQSPTPNPQPPSSFLWTWRVLCGVLLAVLAWHGGLFADRAALASYPFPLDHEEDYLLVHAWRLARGEFYVQPLDEPPFIVGTYNPLFPMLAALFTDVSDPSFFPGRALAVGSALLAALALAALGGKMSRSALFGLCLGGAWLLSRDALRWAPLYRVDFLALALGWLALLPPLFARKDKDEKLALILSGALAVSAYFAKQTAATVPLALALGLIAWRPRLGLIWAGCVAGAVVALTLFFEVISPGSFLFHTITANANEFSAWQLGVWARHFWWFNKVLVVGIGILSLGGMALRAFEKNILQRPQSLDAAGRLSAILYAALGMASFLGAGKLGAADNYMLEPLASLLLLLGIVADRLRRSPEGWARLGAWVALIAPILLAGHLAFSFRPPSDIAPGFPGPRATLGLGAPTASDKWAARVVDGLVARNSARVFCDRASFALRHGAPLVLHPFICAQLAREGKWDDQLALDYLDTLKPRLLILTEDLRPAASLAGDAQYTERFRAWVLKGYAFREELPGTLFRFYLWERS